jgi:hypothetical protein
MKWNGETTLDYWKRVGEWHEWFAWRPVLCAESRKWVWLETVMRRQFPNELGASSEYKERP